MNTKTYAGRLIARLFLCSKSAYTNNRISGGLFSENVTIKTLRFFRLSSFLCSTVTIEIACIRKMMKLINRKTSDYYRTVSLDALTPASEPSYEIKEEVSQDYTLYEKSFQALI